MRHRMKRFGAAITAFFRSRRPLILFTFLFLAGCVLGIRIFCRTDIADKLAQQLTPLPVDDTFGEILRSVASSCFAGWLLLLLLYLSGLSLCGVFVSVPLPFFYGMGAGLSLAGQYSLGLGGVLSSALFIVPHTILIAAALLIGCCETAQMSSVVGRQLFPSSARGGEVSQAFRVYSLRFGLLAVLILAAGVINTLIRIFLYPIV